jgi:phage FluMu protein gp41
MTEKLLSSIIRHLNQLEDENRLKPEQIKAIAAFVAEVTAPGMERKVEKLSAGDFYRLQERTIKKLHDITAAETGANGYCV